MSTDPMTCKELVELVTEYFEGALSAEETLRFEAHLALCPHCETYVEQLRQTVAMTGRLSEEEIDRRTQDELLDMFRDWKSYVGQGD